VRGKRRLSPREACTELVARSAGGKVALVFGDERSGMTNQDVDRCHALSAVPTDADQPSINLAQAALLYCYEVHLAALSATPQRPGPLPTPATDEEQAGVEAALARALRGGGFLREEERHAIRDLIAPFRRAGLSKKEAGLWRAALEATAKRLSADRDREPKCETSGTEEIPP
jgi:tRNA C32,U32 (ribose-2'-O)-methylase TrmJ